MFIGKTIIYPDLQKTGSTHLRRLFMSLPSEEGRKYRKHTPLHQIPSADLTDWERKTKLGSIRNPWAWYVSLWAYGCSGRGDIHNKTTRFRWEILRKHRNVHYLFTPRHRWKATYADHSPENFKAWLRLVFSQKRKYDLGEYGQSPISLHAGLFTYRYLRLYTLGFEGHQSHISQKADIIAWNQQHNFLDCIIRQERLNEDFRIFIAQQGISPSTETLNLLQGESNTSPHEHFQHYYDSESQAWVAEREWFIIDKYGYKF